MVREQRRLRGDAEPLIANVPDDADDHHCRASRIGTDPDSPADGVAIRKEASRRRLVEDHGFRSIRRIRRVVLPARDEWNAHRLEVLSADRDVSHVRQIPFVNRLTFHPERAIDAPTRRQRARRADGDDAGRARHGANDAVVESIHHRRRIVPRTGGA